MPSEYREFQARMQSFDQVHELPQGWPADRLQALLAGLQVDDVPDPDALEMTLLALQDLKPAEAAECVLEAEFGDTMRPGVRRNLAHDLGEERPWEEFADIEMQVGIFNALVLLQPAFPREFGEPDAVSVVVELDTPGEKGKALLHAPTPDPVLLLRILAAGMDDRSILRRLYGEGLGELSEDGARAILWRASRRLGETGAGVFTLVSSHQWFDALKPAESWIARIPREDE